jgi:hypothetical protein
MVAAVVCVRRLVSNARGSRAAPALAAVQPSSCVPDSFDDVKCRTIRSEFPPQDSGHFSGQRRGRVEHRTCPARSGPGDLAGTARLLLRLHRERLREAHLGNAAGLLDDLASGGFWRGRCRGCELRHRAGLISPGPFEVGGVRCCLFERGRAEPHGGPTFFRAVVFLCSSFASSLLSQKLVSGSRKVAACTTIPINIPLFEFLWCRPMTPSSDLTSIHPRNVPHLALWLILLVLPRQ